MDTQNVTRYGHSDNLQQHNFKNSKEKMHIRFTLVLPTLFKDSIYCVPKQWDYRASCIPEIKFVYTEQRCSRFDSEQQWYMSGIRG